MDALSWVAVSTTLIVVVAQFLSCLQQLRERAISIIRGLGTGSVVRNLMRMISAKSPEKLAWELLSHLLTPEQKIEAVRVRRITERGQHGIYEIPLQVGFVRFTPHRRLKGWYSPRYPHLGPALDSRSYAEICLRYTIINGPWYDACATFLLYIRAGREESLFERGNIVQR